MKFEFRRLELPEVVLVEHGVFEDERGWFTERYKQSAFADAGLTDLFVQTNMSHSGPGVLRGFHYQLPPFDQAKLVGVVSGEIFDVAVDIREGSPTFGRWVGETLSAENRRMLYVPSGFAHAFLVTGDHATVTYETTHEYAKEFERGIRWDDEDIGVPWPLERVRGGPRLSDKDRSLPRLLEADPHPRPEGNA